MKLRNACCLGLFLVVASLLAAQPSNAPCGAATAKICRLASWPKDRFDLANTGFNPYETVLSPDTVGNLVVDWQYSTGGTITMSPTVVNGLAYIGSADDNLYALNAYTGALVWKFTTGSLVVASSVAVVNNVVYFGSWDNNVYALNAVTGALLWKYTTGAYIDSSPAVANGIVYIGSSDNNVYALNAATGALVWMYTTGGDVHSSAAVVNGIVYIGSEDLCFYALDAATGARVWRYCTTSLIDSSPAVVNGVVYFGAWEGDDHLYALDAATGT